MRHVHALETSWNEPVDHLQHTALSSCRDDDVDERQGHLALLFTGMDGDADAEGEDEGLMHFASPTIVLPASHLHVHAFGLRTNVFLPVLQHTGR